MGEIVLSNKERKAQYTSEIKLAAVQQFLCGDKTTRELARAKS